MKANLAHYMRLTSLVIGLTITAPRVTPAQVISNVSTQELWSTAQRDSVDPVALYHLSIALTGANQVQQAESCLVIAVTIDPPENGGLLFDLGLALADAGRDSAAVDELK